MSNSNIFDNYPKPAIPGNIVPAAFPKRPSEYAFKRDWYIDQIFDPDLHDNDDIWVKYVIPHVGELVKDTINRKLYIVTAIDESTYRTTLSPFSYIDQENANVDYPLFPRHEYGMIQGELPLLIDYSVTPPIARVTNLAYVANPAYALLYEGSTVTKNQNPISALYSSRDYVSDRIPLTTVMPAGFNVENSVLKCTNTFSVILPKETLKNGTRCTLVFYDTNNNPIAPTYSLMVQHSEYLRDNVLSRKFIKSIELLSPWFTNSNDPETLYIPVNLPLTDVEFKAKVNYSDGSSITKSISTLDDYGGFTLHGTKRFKPTSPGQRGALVLTYFFQEEEEAYLVQPGQPNHISQKYNISAVQSDGAYSPRLYTYPYWSGQGGYKLRHYLSDMTRRFIKDVTSSVRVNQVSPAFSGNTYGVEQALTFNLTLSDVSPSYSNWTFSQPTTVILYNEGTSDQRKWSVVQSSSTEVFKNLEVLFVPNENGQTALFEGTYENVTEFLNRAYYPIIDTTIETKPLVPTHMTLYRENGSSVTVNVDSYNALSLGDWVLNPAETLFIAWVYRDITGNELQLGISAAITRQVSTLHTNR